MPAAHYYDDEADDVSFDNAPLGRRAVSSAANSRHNGIHA